MVERAVAILVAAVSAAVVTPWVRQLAVSVGAVDRPGPRKVHSVLTPRLGGLALAAALGCGVLASSAAAGTALLYESRWWGLLVGAGIILVLGMYDDIHSAGIPVKATFQALAALAIWGGGIRIDTLELGPVGTFHLGVLGPVVTLIWLIGVTNAINFLDGIDGLAAGTGVILAAAFALILGGSSVPTLVSILASAAIGGCAVMVVNNLRVRKKMFLGDSGSLLLGLLLASLALLVAESPAGHIHLATPCLALAVPTFDALICIVRRILIGRSPFTADHGHLHHMLLSAGLSTRTVVLVLCGTTAACSTAAIALGTASDGITLTLLMGVGVALIAIYAFFGYASPRLWRDGRRIQRILYRLLASLRQDASVDVARIAVARAARIVGIDYVRLHRGEHRPDATERRAPVLTIGEPRGPVSQSLVRSDSGSVVAARLGRHRARYASQIFARELVLFPVLVEFTSRIPPGRSDATGPAAQTETHVASRRYHVRTQGRAALIPR